MKTRRADASDEQRRQAAHAVTTCLDQIPGFEEVSSVSLYYPVRGEFDTLALFDELARRGIATSLPVTGQEAQPLSFFPWRPGEPLETGAHDIPVPANRTLSVVPDVIILPLLGFDASGHRLGYGGGHYDRTLEALRQILEVAAVGLAFEFQEVETLVVEPHDQRLDYILTPAGVRCFQER